MQPEHIAAAARKLGFELILTKDGPAFKLTGDIKLLNTEQLEAARKLRVAAGFYRDALVRYLGGNPDDYIWIPPEGTEERKWYEHAKSCAEQKEADISTGPTGSVWDHQRDGKRLLASCRNNEQWKTEAQRFWWDTTHATHVREKGQDLTLFGDRA